jgi:hypothetical protein
VLHAFHGALGNGWGGLPDLRASGERQRAGDEEQHRADDQCRKPDRDHSGEARDHGREQRGDTEQCHDAARAGETGSDTCPLALLRQLGARNLQLAPDQFTDLRRQPANELTRRDRREVVLV